MKPDFLDAVRELGEGGEAGLEEVLSAVHFGVFVDHAERGCIYANDEVLRMFEMSWESFAGFGWAQAILPSDMEVLREAIERYEREKTWVDVHYRIRVPDGSVRALHVVGRAVVDEDGAHRGSVMIGREVTAERAVKERAAQLQKLQAIGRLASRVAHDFNNLLTPIMFSAALLGEDTTEVQRDEHVDTILRSVEHATAITGQLLGLSRQHRFGDRVVEIDEELRRMQSILSQGVGHRVDLRLELHVDGYQVGLAPSELAQVVLNLVVNAADAGARQVTLSTALAEDRVELRVRDDGGGMPVAVQERIFEPFYTTKSSERGTGLGLYTVQELVTLAGGKVHVQSTEGVGTTFRVALPALAASRIERIHGAAAQHVPPCSILLVDDNAALRQTLAYVLALRGHSVQSSASVERALQLAREHDFDVVVSDLLLLDGHGTDVVRALREARADIRVIYMSGYAGELDEEALAGPHTVFLPKPFPPNRLMAALAEAMR